MNGNTCAGFLISLGSRGVEAFDAAEKSLGIFPDAPSAAAVVQSSVAPAAPLVEPAHSKFGGSAATRILHCPASVGLVAKVPKHLRRSSVYAERGTALHVAIALLLDEKESFESLAGQTIGSYAVTHDDVENALRPAFVYLVTLLDTPEAEFYLEQRATFPTIAGAFGTADLIVRIDDTIHVVDLKFGSGVRVRALYPDGDEDVINAQLLFYAAAARHSLPKFFAGVEKVTLTIVQPQSIEPDTEMVSSVTITHDELDEFVVVYRAACEEALAPAPRLEKGAHCRFCPARPICPAHTGPLLDLAQLAMPAAPVAPVDKAAYLQALAAGLDLVDAIKDIRTALHDQAKHALEQGDSVPGYALSAGRAERYWRDENAAFAALQSAGFYYDDVMKAEMRSPKQVELRAKARSLEIPKELIGSRRSGVSLVRSENVRVPVPGRGELARSLSAAFEAFLEGGNHDQRPRS
jgi:hypothetical protein